MIDKVQRIREEVERLRNLHQMKYQQLDADSNMSLVECGKRNLCNELLLFIDSLQEEHKLKPKFQEGNKIVYVGERKELDTDEHTILYVYDDMYVTTWGKKIPFKFQDDYQLVEEPVSEDLEEAGKQYLERSNPDRVHQITNAFKAGAKWQKEKDFQYLKKECERTKVEEYISWGDMSEEEKAEFFKSNPFKIKKHE